MIELLSLTFSGIRCFDKEQTINFASKDSLVQIDGPSGSGKTTIGMALDYLLGVCDVPSTVLQSRLTKTMSVRGEFLFDGKKVEITRDKKDGLKLVLENEEVSGNSKIAEEKLDEILVVPRKVFRKMFHKKQKEGGFFMKMTAKEMYEFLVEILGIKKYLEYTENVKKEISDKEDELKTLRSSSDNIESSVSELSNVLEQKTPPEEGEKDLAKWQKTILELTGTIETEESKLATLLEQNKREKEALPQPAASEDVFNTSILDKLKSALTTIEEQKQTDWNLLANIREDKLRAENNVENARGIGAEVQQREARIEHIEASTCPTCKQQWSGDQARDEIDKLRAEIDAFKTKALSAKNDYVSIPVFVSKMEELSKEITSKEEKIKQISERIEEQKKLAQEFELKNKHRLLDYENKLLSIDVKFNNDISEVKSNIKNMKDGIESCQWRYNNVKAQIDTFNKEINSLQERIKEKRAEHRVLLGKIEEVEKETKVASESIRLVKGYILQICQDTLDTIGETATEFLSHIPNTCTSTIYFEICKENQDKSVKDEINAIINMNGTNKVPIKSLSGGERTSVDLAVDLAVIDTIESKAGKGADFFILDEPFDGLDSVCKENCLEMLKQVDSNKRLIIVDHSSELKEMVSDIIRVEKNGESSVIFS